MSAFQRWKRLLDLRLDSTQEYACEFLESRGLKFCVDYEHENAISLAINLYLAELEVPW